MSIFMAYFIFLDVEKSCVSWQDDDKVKNCPNCQKKFTLTFRKHHCRLCGKVVCEICLDILDTNLASKLDLIDNSSLTNQPVC